MNKKEELIKKYSENINFEFIEDREACLSRIYDDIRASILTPKIVALLKAIGSKPEYCDECSIEKEDADENPFCGLTYTNIHDGYLKCMDDCPLLSSEEFAEITGGDR